MPWIFGSFLMTPCALTSCHVVISKQDSTIRALGTNRCVTGRRPHDENHAVRFRQRQKIRVELGTRSRSEVSLLSRGCKHWLPEGDMGRRSPLSEYMSLHLSLKQQQQQTAGPFENKTRDIFL